ncbi:MAG: glycosyltransferase family 39 protein [Chloroflexota bacterium]|nr:glycosyltransferase family 39 protein [Chloroflexota bacterium]
MSKDVKVTRISPQLLVALLAAWALLLFRLGAPWVGHQDENGAWMSTAIRNFQQVGFGTLNGMIVLNTVPFDADAPYTPYVNHPPLPVWLPTAFVLAIGYDEAIVRFVFACTTLISFAVLYTLTRRLFDQQTALWAVVLYAFTPMIAYFGRMPDHEAPALLLLLLFTLALLRWRRRPLAARWGVAAVLMVLIAWTAWGGLIVAGMLCSALFIGGNRRAALGLIGVATAAVIGLMAYYIINYPDTMSTIIDSFSLRSSDQSFRAGSESFTWIGYSARMGVRWLTLFTPGTFFLALLGAVWLARRDHQARAWIFAWLVGGLIFIIIFRNGSYVHDYYLIYTFPPLAILAAARLTRRGARWLRPVLGGLVVTVPIGLIIYLGSLYSGTEQTDPLNVAAVIQAKTEPDDLIISSLPTVGIAIEFYAQRKIWWGVAPEFALEWVAEQIIDGQRAYYFYCGETPLLPLSEPTPVIEGCTIAEISTSSAELLQSSDPQ